MEMADDVNGWPSVFQRENTDRARADGSDPFDSPDDFRACERHLARLSRPFRLPVSGGVLFAMPLNSSSVSGNSLRIAVHTPPGVAVAVVASDPNRTRVGSGLIAAAQRCALSGVGGSPRGVASEYAKFWMPIVPHHRIDEDFEGLLGAFVLRRSCAREVRDLHDHVRRCGRELGQEDRRLLAAPRQPRCDRRAHVARSPSDGRSPPGRPVRTCAICSGLW